MKLWQPTSVFHFKIMVCASGHWLPIRYNWRAKGEGPAIFCLFRWWRPSLCTDVVCFPVARSLEQLLVSLQWGRQQTYYPSAQPLSTGELAAANQKLADAINSHLLGNTSSSSSSVVKSSSAPAEHICSTPAEKMAEKVRTLNPSTNLPVF